MKALVMAAAILSAATAGPACTQRHQQACKAVEPEEFAKEISADSSAYLLDVRTPEEFAQGHIEGAHNLDWLDQEEFKKDVEEIPCGSTVYVYCRSGRRSGEAAEYLCSQGFDVVDLDGGYLAWERRQR